MLQEVQVVIKSDTPVPSPLIVSVMTPDGCTGECTPAGPPSYHTTLAEPLLHSTPATRQGRFAEAMRFAAAAPPGPARQKRVREALRLGPHAPPPTPPTPEEEEDGP